MTADIPIRSDLTHAYRAQLDPRLNYDQALEMTLLLARRMFAR